MVVTKRDIRLSLQLTNLAVEAGKLLQIMRGSELETNSNTRNTGNTKAIVILLGKHKKLKLVGPANLNGASNKLEIASQQEKL